MENQCLVVANEALMVRAGSFNNWKVVSIRHGAA
jgi:hypothetical protein